MRTKRAFLVEPGRFEISDVDISTNTDQVMIKVAVCGLCNWELNHFKGLLGTCPQSLGHEWAGEVVEVGCDVKNVSVGDMVTGLPDSLTGFSEYITVGAKNCFKLTPNVDPCSALGEPLKCIITVLRATAPEVGDHGVVVGCGPMGLWCIQGLNGKYLSSLIAVDVDDEKLKLAKKFGATHTINSRSENAKQKINEITEGRMADFVIEGTGIPAVLNTSINYVKSSGRGRLLLMSSHEEVAKEFDFREAISRSIEIRVPHPGYSLNQLDDMRRTVAYINSTTFQMDEIISHKFSLDQIQKAFETLEHKPLGYIKGVIVF